MTQERTRTKLYIVLPAYNEEECLRSLLEHIDTVLFDARRDYQVIVVNDGSVDRTAEIARECGQTMPVLVEDHPRNLGLGATIRDGLVCAAAMASDNDVVLTMDADDTHTPGLIVRMMRMVAEGHDVVIASRYQPGSRVIGVPLLRRFMSGCASVLFRVLLPIHGVKDFTCGYRAYRASVLKRALEEYGERFIDQEGFQCMVDILLKLRKLDLIFGEVPFLLRYDQKAGASKMNVSDTAMKTLRLILKRRFIG
jgi:dolichol-phosphate mannosyltransferase